MGIYEAYNTGRGIIYVRAKTSVEEDKSGNQSLVINEIPYMVNKARMLERIAELVKDKKIDGIREIRDESDNCLLYTSPSPRDGLLSRMPSSA